MPAAESRSARKRATRPFLRETAARRRAASRAGSPERSRPTFARSGSSGCSSPTANRADERAHSRATGVSNRLRTLRRLRADRGHEGVRRGVAVLVRALAPPRPARPRPGPPPSAALRSSSGAPAPAQRAEQRPRATPATSRPLGGARTADSSVARAVFARRGASGRAHPERTRRKPNAPTESAGGPWRPRVRGGELPRLPERVQRRRLVRVEARAPRRGRAGETRGAARRRAARRCCSARPRHARANERARVPEGSSVSPSSAGEPTTWTP